MSNLCPAPPVPSSHQGPTKESSQTRWSLCFLTAVKHDAGSVLFIQPQINNSKVDPTVAGESPHTADCNQTWSVCYCHWRCHIFGICHAHFKAQMTLFRLQIIRLFVGPLVLLGPGCPGSTSVYLQASGGCRCSFNTLSITYLWHSLTHTHNKKIVDLCISHFCIPHVVSLFWFSVCYRCSSWWYILFACISEPSDRFLFCLSSDLV